MTPEFDIHELEKKARSVWDSSEAFACQDTGKKKFSMFLIPPNASGPLHIGNALMVALQDILARYYRMKQYDVVWVPGLDHGGYETQVTYEREAEETGGSHVRSEIRSDELYKKIEAFVDTNKQTVISQIDALGASVDWNQLRFTLDEKTLESANAMFGQMVDDKIIDRKPYMMNYCPNCMTVLADIELKKEERTAGEYFVNLISAAGEESVKILVREPEFLWTVSHILAHPQDERFASLIDSVYINPITGKEISVVASARKLDWHMKQDQLEPFMPAAVRFDYEYAVRNNLPYPDVLDWGGRFVEMYEGMLPSFARQQAVAYLEENNFIAEVREGCEEVHYCKKGHEVTNLIRLTWSLSFDAGESSIRQRSLDLLNSETLFVHPAWRKKGLVDWIKKIHDWPIARQNAWGIKIPIWYEVSDPTKFLVWFFDKDGRRQHGNLNTFLNEGVAWQEILDGLQQVYATGDCEWTTEPAAGKPYLPETDTFDTWYTSGAWSVFAFEHLDYFDQVYPSDSVVIGTDLLRLSIARKIMLSAYLTGKLPFKRVYFHPLLNGPDGQKMSKSIGNVVTLESYLENYGSDVTRMALVSYMSQSDDFVFEDTRLAEFKHFSQRLWAIARAYQAVELAEIDLLKKDEWGSQDTDLLNNFERLVGRIGNDIEKHFLARAQDSAVKFLDEIESTLRRGIAGEVGSAGAVVVNVFPLYLSVLHPFMPFVTEAIFSEIKNEKVLATNRWPKGSLPPNRRRRR